VFGSRVPVDLADQARLERSCNFFADFFDFAEQAFARRVRGVDRIVACVDVSSI
jgi:hypothetical protein